MTIADWERVIDQSVSLGAATLQFIGGEPTLHPGLRRLVSHALARGVEVEVFTNLVRVSPQMWETFARPGVRLATSWYSDDPDEHARITGRPSHDRTKAAIAEALRRGIPLRVGIIGVREGQRVDQAAAMLADMGVPQIGYDDLRQVGRGVRDTEPGPDQLCGNCADGVLAISADGAVWPCVFSRWMTVGNVLEQPLAEILAGRARAARAELGRFFAARAGATGACRPDRDANCGPKRSCYPDCNPSPCQPQCAPRCGPSCNPCAPSRRCWPSYR